MDNLLKPVTPVTPSKAPNTHSKPMDRIETSHSFNTAHASALESIKAAVLQVFFFITMIYETLLLNMKII